MGERILRDEGFEVVSLTDGNAAMLRLADVDPDLILADVFLPGKSGFELCRYVKNEPRFRHVRVVLTAGLLEPFDESEAKRAGCDAILKKPFEGSKVIGTLAPLVKEAQAARTSVAEEIPAARPIAEAPKAVEPAVEAKAPEHPATAPALEPAAVPEPEIDRERVRAAVTIALDAAMPAMIQEITERVLIALGQ